MIRVAIVLGAAVRPDGGPSETLRLRVEHGVALHRAGQVSHLCLTGGQGRHGAPEAQVAADLARAADVPGSALILEAASRNTYENLAYAHRLLPPDTAEIVIVSNRWHLPRARLIARLLGLNARVSGPPGCLSWPATVGAILREILATPSSALRAWRGRDRSAS
ncbi:MAG: YdcF family protein [Pseudomonadota bacterium]